MSPTSAAVIYGAEFEEVFADLQPHVTGLKLQDVPDHLKPQRLNNAIVQLQQRSDKLSSHAGRALQKAISLRASLTKPASGVRAVRPGIPTLVTA